MPYSRQVDGNDKTHFASRANPRFPLLGLRPVMRGIPEDNGLNDRKAIDFLVAAGLWWRVSLK